MSEKFKVTTKRAIGIILIIMGILGILLPVLPGVWFIPLGLELLGWRLVIDRKKPWKEIIELKQKEVKDN